MVKGSVQDILSKPEADLVIDYTLNRKKRGLYTLIFVAGLPGSGKTSTCYRLGELITEAYEGKNTMSSEKIIDSFLELTKFVINSSPDKLCVAVVEEVSVLFPSRRAMSGVNVDLARLLDTCRKKQVILLANAPLWTSIDSHMKSMGSVYIETKKIYKQAKIVYSKMFRLQTNPRTGKTYTHSFHRGDKDVRKMYTKMPNLEEWEKYEGRKDEFMKKLYDKLVIREKKRQEKDDKEIGKYKENAGLNEEELRIYNMRVLKKMKQKDIAKKESKSQQYISIKLRDISKKLQNTKENG